MEAVGVFAGTKSLQKVRIKKGSEREAIGKRERGGRVNATAKDDFLTDFLGGIMTVLKLVVCFCVLNLTPANVLCKIDCTKKRGV